MMPPRKELAAKLAELGTQTKVAEHYGVSVGTVSRWMVSLQLPTRESRETG